MAKQQKKSSDDKVAEALDLYLNTNLTQKEICVYVGWTEKTFSLNKKNGNWEAMKGAKSVTNQNIIMKLYAKLEKEVEADSLNADSLYKISKAIEMLSDKKTNASNHINCAEEFTTYLFSLDPELAKKVNKHQEKFISTLFNNGN